MKILTETKKHKQADKKLNGALSTFTNAVAEVEKAIDLKVKSIEADEKQMLEIDAQITELTCKRMEIQTGMVAKQGEVLKHRELADKLKGFTV